MSKSGIEPKASSTAVKSQDQRSLRNYLKNSRNNETFGSTYSDELTDCNLGTKTLSEMSSNKKNLQMDSMYSSFGGQSSLGIFELENMSDIGNIYKKESSQYNIHNNQPVLQRRLSQATQARNTLARASSIKNIVNNNEVNEQNVRSSLINVTNSFKEMLKSNFNDSCSSFSSNDFICGSDFKEKLAETEEINRKEFGSLSESRFDFSLEGEKQSNENASFAANYFAAKSIPVEDLSAIFPKRKNCNNTFTKELKGSSFSVPSDIKNNPEDQQAHVGYKTMSSITSWTDSHVSNNLLNLTSLSDISEVLTSKTNSANPKELTEVLLSGDLSDDRQLNESYKFPQRRLSTSTRFSYASQNLEHAELYFQSLENCSFISPQKKITSIHETTLELNESNSVKNYDNNSEIWINTSNQYTPNKKQTQTQINKSCHFFLTPKSGYFEDCTLGTSEILENNIDLSNFSILTNNHEVLTEMSLDKSTNISKIVHCNESISQDKLNQSNVQDYRKISKMLEIGDICIGTYSQAVITLENQLTIEAKYTLYLLDTSLNHNNDFKFDENKAIGSNVATIFCSDKTCIIPPLSEASFTIGIIPLVSGSINIYIQLKSDDISQEIYRNIQIHSIEPQVSWINNSFGSIDFGLLPELTKKSLPIKLMNKGTYQVPIKFILNQDNCDDIIQAKAILKPSELWQCDVNMLTTHFSKTNCKLTGRLQVVLDSVEQLSTNYSPLLYCCNLTGRVGFTSISFDQNPLLLQKSGRYSLNGTIEITNNSEIPISLSVLQNNKQCGEFTIQPDKFKLAVKEKVKMNVVFSPSKSINYFNETSICLQVVSSQKQFFFKVNYIESKVEFQQMSSPSSRPISPWSTSSSSAVGRLELESTCSSLIWGSVPSNTKSVQTFTLRNRGLHKEKLHLRIKDNRNCFKLISSGENQVTEMKLLLEPMESQKLSVALISTSNEGQAYGHLILQRQHSNDKRVISLYGYCGHSVIVIRGPFEDNFGNMWLYPNPQLMTSQLSITNSGNTAAFVKFIQENSSEDIIQPDEFILKKGETANVEITIVMSPERLEMLIGQNCSSKVININKISLIYGDEASRMRLSRLWKKNKDKKKIVYLNQQRLDEISNMFNGVHLVNVDHLEDTEKSLPKLWKMGISEDSIVVLMETSNLESLLCDTTTVFSELETTVISRLP
ncbi:uncharacterized protein LOC100161585 isoform X2 [Acyrthosiphon pisum]|uniref:Uncharacterized protein n=1 Tax=Acyrthosiphon pisum TaxID=7029 RepID=A0A8R2H5G2_ACYPI|nr:uncharacterized protein LOC100161585 isoform X2 [Acyrthosiphon pisum]|eukprot:XP_016658195.1 PREDICTED: uncharacterized protein LOC100161585 isoform X2 [Acyrthosiphon pisum]